MALKQVVADDIPVDSDPWDAITSSAMGCESEVDSGGAVLT